MFSYHIEDRLTMCPAQVVVVRGVKDPIAPHKWAVAMTSMLTNGSLVEVPGAGHVVQFSQAKKWQIYVPHCAKTNIKHQF